LNGLALCAGVGGLELGLGLAVPEYKCVGYVEREAFAASVIVARMEDKALDQAPIWDDLETFPSKDFREKVDIISAGFPCQPWSTAGKGKGLDDDRWLWPAISRIICEVGPGIVFLENVPGLLDGGIGPILGDLAQAGYDAEWGCFSAAEVGASHLRKRVFIMAYAQGSGAWGKIRDVCQKNGRQKTRRVQLSSGPDTEMENTTSSGLEGSESHGLQYELGPFPPLPGDIDGWKYYRGPQPALRRGPDGMAYWVDRIRVIGNGVVPLEAAYAFRTLAARGGLI